MPPQSTTRAPAKNTVCNCPPKRTPAMSRTAPATVGTHEIASCRRSPASSYQFCRVNAKTNDHYFLGFPSYFDVVAFYAIVFEPGPDALAAVLVICSLLVFVPIRYVYPTRTI